MTLRCTMDKIGPLARGVEDCAIVLNALYGPDGRDDTVVDLPFAWDGGVQLGALTIGFIEDEFASAAAEGSEEDRRRWPAHKRVLGVALDVMRRAGARLKPVTMPDFPV